MTLRIQPVPLEFVHATWPLVSNFVQNALDEGIPYPKEYSLYNADNVLQAVAKGEWLLVVGVDEEGAIQGAATVAFTNFPLHRVAFVTTLGGRFVTSQETYDQLKAICKQNGATILQAFGRESIIRLWRRFDFQTRNTLVEVLL